MIGMIGRPRRVLNRPAKGVTVVTLIKGTCLATILMGISVAAISIALENSEGRLDHFDLNFRLLQSDEIRKAKGLLRNRKANPGEDCDAG